MAKITGGHTRISGKLDGLVYVPGGPHGGHVRNAPPTGRRKNEPQFKKQHSRTAYLNRLASTVNNAMNQLAGPLKNRRFYETVQKLLRKETEDNRLLLLRRLVGMEANTRYPFHHHVQPEITVAVTDRALTVSVVAREHPPYKGIDVNCYTYDVLLTTWPGDEGVPEMKLQGGSWLPLAGPGVVFDFEFPVAPGAQHWMVCVKLSSGINNVPTGLFPTDGAVIYKIGSFDAAEQAWLESLPPIRDEKKPEPKEEPAPVARVAPKPLPKPG